MTEPFLILGHRGSPRRFPENTVASFEEALRAGADGFETDLRLLGDGTAVLYHDDELGDAEIESLTIDECTTRGAHLQRVDDLAAFLGRAQMVLEVKRSHWEDVLLEHVARWPGIVIASFDHSLIAELARRKVEVPLGLTVFGYLVHLPRYAKRLGVQWVYPNHRYVDKAMVKALHKNGVRIVPWTANRPRDWERLRAAGCDGIITDIPDAAVAWRGR